MNTNSTITITFAKVINAMIMVEVFPLYVFANVTMVGNVAHYVGMTYIKAINDYSIQAYLNFTSPEAIGL